MTAIRSRLHGRVELVPARSFVWALVCAAFMGLLGACGNADPSNSADTAATAGAGFDPRTAALSESPSGLFSKLLHIKRVLVGGNNGAQIALSSDAGDVVSPQFVQTPAAAPSNYNYLEGFYSYQVSGIKPGATINVAITVPQGVTAPTGYVRCNTSLSSCGLDTSAQIIGNTIFVAITDGGPGDEDGTVNGVIVDSGAPVVTSATAPYLLPYSANSQATGGKTGIFVVPSNSLTNAPQYLTPSADPFGAATASRFLTDTNGQVTAQVPYGLVYQASATSGGSHLYKVDLTTSAAKPVQVTNYAGGNCEFSIAPDQADLTDPSTAYFILAEPGPSAACGAPDTQFLLYHYTDSATTAPLATPIGQGNASIVTFHNTSTGKLDGVVLVDTAGKLDYYADTGFTSPKTLLTGVNGFTIIYASAQNAFLAVYKSGTDSTGAPIINSATLYRVDNTGAISTALYTFQSGSCFFGGAITAASTGIQYGTYPSCSSTGTPTPDGTSLFFTDNTATYGSASPYPVASYSDKLLKVALNGSAVAQTVNTYAGGAPALPSKNDDPVTVQVTGFIGTGLLFTVDAYGTEGSGYPGYLYTIDQGASSSSAIKQIASLTDGYFGAGYIAQGMDWVNVHSFDSATGLILPISVEAIGPDGAVARTYPASEIQSPVYAMSGTPANATPVLTSLLILSKFYPYESGAVEYSGTTLKKISFSDLSLSQMYLIDGQPYTNYTNTIPGLTGYTDPVGGFTQSDYYNDAMAADFVDNTVVQLTTDGYNNTDFEPLF